MIKFNARVYRSVKSFGLLLFLPLCSYAQDIESLKDQKILMMNGGISSTTTFYHADGIERRRDPFYWLVNANLNFNLLGIIQAPFSMVISQQDKKFAQPQPFNRFGLSPRYKNITAHFGHRTMSFSEYTLSGNMFLGAGVELNAPGRSVRVSAMWGRLAKAVQRSAQQGLVFANPSYKRIGFGVKIGLGRKRNMVDLIFFKGKDDEKSIQLIDDIKVTPEENLVASLHGKHEMTEKLIIEYEYAYSMFTRDMRSGSLPASNYSFANNLGGLFTPNMSSEFNNAFTGALLYNGSWYQANFKYRKIDPGYKTLGSAFLNNGLKDMTGGLSWSMFGKTINLSANAGIQENNDNTKVIRSIYSMNVNYSANKRLSLFGNFSNFSTTNTQSQIQRDLLSDTLEYFQVTRNVSVNTTCKLGADDSDVTIALNASFQETIDGNSEPSRLNNFSFGFQRKIGGKWQLNLNATLNENLSKQFHNRSAGPVINVNRSFLAGNFRSAFSASMLNSYLDAKLQTKVVTGSLINSIKLFKRHMLGLNLYYLINRSRVEEQRHFKEVRAMFNYNFSF